MDTKELFIDFLINYVSVGHTTTDEAMDELRAATQSYVNSLLPYCYFNWDYVELYCESAPTLMSESNRGFFHFYFNKNRYIDFLQNEIIRLCHKID